MKTIYLLLPLAVPIHCHVGRQYDRTPQHWQRDAMMRAIVVPSAPPEKAAKVLLESFLSYSVEFAWWPEFSGNLSVPNTFTRNLLANFEDHQGSKPHIRVGGNTQDNSLYDETLKTATNKTFGNPNIQYPTTARYGPSFFEGYQVLEGVKFGHGFNLGVNGTAASEELTNALTLACASIRPGSFAYWELGNEADQFASNKSNRPPIRPRPYVAENYLADWRNRTAMMKDIYERAGCGHLPFKFIGPSFAGLTQLVPAFEQNFTRDGNVIATSVHNYIGSSNDINTLKGTLLNHTRTVSSVEAHASRRETLEPYGLNYILGEGNSLSSQGKLGISDSFGGALWSVDFALYAASQGIQRIHYHQGVNYNYASWQPVHLNQTVPGTKPPYYGNIAVAATVGDVKENKVQVVNMPLETEFESAYSIYTEGKLSKIGVLNLNEFNSTGKSDRPSKRYFFDISQAGVKSRVVKVQRLQASGSDAISGITFAGYSYNYELDNGKPVLLNNMTKWADEKLYICNGTLTIDVPSSGYALLSLT